MQDTKVNHIKIQWNEVKSSSEIMCREISHKSNQIKTSQMWEERDNLPSDGTPTQTAAMPQVITCKSQPQRNAVSTKQSKISHKSNLMPHCKSQKTWEIKLNRNKNATMFTCRKSKNQPLQNTLSSQYEHTHTHTCSANKHTNHSQTITLALRNHLQNNRKQNVCVFQGAIHVLVLSFSFAFEKHTNNVHVFTTLKTKIKNKNINLISSHRIW